MTLDQLAANLGVSKGTVSRAMNGKGRMAADTRERILAAMQAAGYTPDPTAQELSRRSRHSIGISLSGGGAGPYFTAFWRSLVQVASERGTRFIEMGAALESYVRLPGAVLLFFVLLTLAPLRAPYLSGALPLLPALVVFQFSLATPERLPGPLPPLWRSGRASG